MDHNTGRQRAQKPFRMIKESNPSVKPFMWRVLREPKNFATQRLGYYLYQVSRKPVDTVMSVVTCMNSLISQVNREAQKVNTQQLPVRRAWHPRLIATSDEEHAVSTVMAGPNKLYTYDTLALRILEDRPVTMYVLSMFSESWYTRVLKSSFITPKNMIDSLCHTTTKQISVLTLIVNLLIGRISHRIGGNPERQTAIDERRSIFQPAFYGMSIKLFFSTERKC